MEDLIKEISSQLNKKIEYIKELKPEYADSIENTFRSVLEEIDSYPYLKKLSELTELNDCFPIPEGTEDRP